MLLKKKEKVNIGMEKAYGGKSQEVDCPSQVHCKKKTSSDKKTGCTKIVQKQNKSIKWFLTCIHFVLYFH